jgi:cytochrome c-type biogenesis protein CcmH
MRALLLTLLLLTGASVAAAPESEALPAEAQQRYQRLINELRCLVCQNQSIAESNAPLAVDLREQVALQLAAGRSDGEIRRYLTDRYGDFVLYKPPLRARTLLLWAGPALLLVLGLLIALRQTRRHPPPSPPPPGERLKNLLDRHPPC